MKYISSLLITVLIASCSHAERHYEDHHESHDDKDFVWSHEHKQIEKQHKEASEIFKWFEEHMKNHNKEVAEHKQNAQVLQRKMKKLGGDSSNSIEIKKIKLNLGRQHEKMNEDHRHFLADHNEFMKLIEKLKVLKEEFQSHEGHDH